MLLSTMFGSILMSNYNSGQAAVQGTGAWIYYDAFLQLMIRNYIAPTIKDYNQFCDYLERFNTLIGHPKGVPKLVSAEFNKYGLVVNARWEEWGD